MPPMLILLEWFLLNAINSIPGTVFNLALTKIYLDHQRDVSPQEISKKAQQAARESDIPAYALKNFRLVTNKLVVRVNPKSRSPKQGSLKAGSLVQVFEQTGSFSLIRWTDPQKEAHRLEGWVYSRYLKKFH